MATALGGYQHPISTSWVVDTRVEEPSRTGAYFLLCSTCPHPSLTGVCGARKNTAIQKPGLCCSCSAPSRTRLAKLIASFDATFSPLSSPAPGAFYTHPCPLMTPRASTGNALLQKGNMTKICARPENSLDALLEPLLNEKFDAALHSQPLSNAYWQCK